MRDCICTPVENPYTHMGAVEPGGALEPEPDCPVHFPCLVCVTETKDNQ